MFSKAISELKNDKCVDAPWGMNDTGVRSMSFWSLQKTKSVHAVQIWMVIGM